MQNQIENRQTLRWGSDRDPDLRHGILVQEIGGMGGVRTLHFADPILRTRLPATKGFPGLWPEVGKNLLPKLGFGLAEKRGKKKKTT